MAQNPPDLDYAYGIKTSDDNRRLYAGWTKSYDANFAVHMQYTLPDMMAEAFVAAGGRALVLDLGAGTGLLGQALSHREVFPFGGTATSSEMLAVAETKHLYCRLFSGDLTARLPVADNSYHGVISTGTFTTGDVGPEALDEVMRVARTGAVIGITVNVRHWQSAGFAAIALKITGFVL